MGSFRTVVVVFVIPTVICLAVIATISFIGHAIPKPTMPMATQTTIAPSATVEIIPTVAQKSFSPENKSAGDMAEVSGNQSTGCISLGLFLLIVVVVIFAGPLQKAARR